MIKKDIKIAKKFSNSSRYIDDLLSINNTNFNKYISKIYPNTLKLNREIKIIKMQHFLIYTLKYQLIKNLKLKFMIKEMILILILIVFHMQFLISMLKMLLMFIILNY